MEKGTILHQPEITNSSQIDYTLGRTFFPFLLTQISQPKFNLLSHVKTYLPDITLTDKYNSILEHIQRNMTMNNVGVATLTIAINDNSHSSRIGSGISSGISSESKTKKTTTRKNTKKLGETHKQNSITRHPEKPFRDIHELIFISINNRTFQTKTDFELLESLRICGTTIFNIARSGNISNFNILGMQDKMILTLLEGILLSSYKFLKYKTNKALNAEINPKYNKYNLARINIIQPRKSISTIQKSIIRIKNIVSSVFMARDLVNEPANDNKAGTFIDMIKQFLASQNKSIRERVKMEILDKEDLSKLGMGLILAVGKGSTPANSPRILIMHYTSPDCHNTKNMKSSSTTSHTDQPSIVLLGKGITYDTGGINLKSPKNMIEMKSDLSGAATVCAFLLGYAIGNGSKCISVICPFAENSIGAASIKPSDVVRAYDGRTVEIANTDAEGRLLLADCLAYAADKYPNALFIDFATLTGQQEDISGKMFSNILGVGAAEQEMKDMILAGQKINELLVPLPIVDTHLDKLVSYVADIKNDTYQTGADIIMSTLFMKQFIKPQTRWIHIDIAGQSFKANEVIKYASPEASGIGVRLLFEYIQNK
jgi:leucyl aminopeptidase